jgi:beta-glucosidase/6-phospho-beta-glucosidase/beta-galactosidase
MGKIRIMKSACIALILGFIIQSAFAQNKLAKKQQFPQGFLWGAASAAYQVEGGTKSDGRGPNYWDKYLNPPYSLAKMSTGEDVNGDISINQYNRVQFGKDVKLMKELGINTYRLSISWSRILPEGTSGIRAF